MKIMKIIKIIYVIIVAFFFLFVASLHLLNPEWFLFQQNSEVIYHLNQDSEAKLKQIPPYESCNYAGKCEWKNIPFDEPYITQTEYAWLYNYQFLIIGIIIISGLLVNSGEIKQWINTHSN